MTQLLSLCPVEQKTAAFTFSIIQKTQARQGSGSACSSHRELRSVCAGCRWFIMVKRLRRRKGFHLCPWTECVCVYYEHSLRQRSQDLDSEAPLSVWMLSSHGQLRTKKKKSGVITVFVMCACVLLFCIQMGSVQRIPAELFPIASSIVDFESKWDVCKLKLKSVQPRLHSCLSLSVNVQLNI